MYDNKDPIELLCSDMIVSSLQCNIIIARDGMSIFSFLFLYVIKVGNCGKWKRALLGALCDFINPVTYMEHPYIVHEGDRVDQVLFVVQGNLQTDNSGNVTTAFIGNDNYLKYGDIFGEEFVAWAQGACP